MLSVFELALFLRVLLSWFIRDFTNPFYNFLFKITEPALAPIRMLFTKSEVTRQLPIDFSPIVLFLIIEVLRSIVNGFYF